MLASNPPPDDLVASCRRCAKPAPAGTVACPACGYDVSQHNHWRLAFGAVGTFLTLSVVFAPIGLPLLWLSARHRRLASGTVTEASPADVTAHLRGVLRYHLAPTASIDPTGDFTRGGAGGRLGRPPEL